MLLSPGDQLGQYEIRSAIGAGGMGEVFRAHDPRLGRDVAIKVLPAATAHDPGSLARFEREARAVAALNHPHIVTIFSVEESNGVHFITMELIEGQPLSYLIRASALTLPQIVAIGGALADALAAAHEKGIVHRDLKPANIMITHENRVKVLDFGLAKDLSETGCDDLTLMTNTQAGMVMGTPAYMSPEQVSCRPLDHRTDIFSLGVVLHEMATGKKPFRGNSSAELVSAILRDEPAPLTDIRPDLPTDLARVIRRCLEKDPRHRVQTARDLANEFRDLLSQIPSKASSPATRAVSSLSSATAPSADGFWVAVLPFTSTGANPELVALADGLSEEIITGLSRFSYLRVIARGSTLSYANQTLDLRTVGRELGARYVMEGSLRVAGTKLRLAVRLADALTGVQLWAENYERPFAPDAIFDLQDDLVPRIVSTVADGYGVLPHSMSEILRSKPDDQLTPHEAVIRAFGYYERFTPVEHALVRNILEIAVQQAPNHSGAWAALANIYLQEHAQGFNLQSDPLGRALAAARRSVDAAPSNHIAHNTLASTLFFQKEFEACRAEVRRAMELNPMNGAALAWNGIMIAYSGDWEEGCAQIEAARQLNPHHPSWFLLPLACNAYRKGDYRSALAFAIKINLPGYFYAHLTRAAAYGQLGMHQPAQKALNDMLALRPDMATAARQELAKWWDPGLVEHIIDGLRKAGMNIQAAEVNENLHPALTHPAEYT
jgi:serine/threonine protein kinase/tetratricopeptide (TPR) repeat protein